MKEYYEILELGPKATPAEIRKAYHRLALLYHPDKNPTSRQKFENIHKAYTTLSDPIQRQIYDENPDRIDKQYLDELKALSIDSFYEKLTVILKEVREKIKNQALSLPELLAQQEFLSVLLAIHRLKVRDIWGGAKLKPINILVKELIHLSSKLDEQIKLKTRTEVLNLQDSLQENFKIAIQNNLEAQKLFTDKNLFKICPYDRSITLEFKIVPESFNNIHALLVKRSDQKELTQKQFIIDTIQKSSFSKFLILQDKSFIEEIISPDTLTYSISLNYFNRNDSLSIESLEKPESKALSREEIYKKRLMDYIETRSKQKKYTGSRFGYSRKEKVEAAQALYDVIAGRLNPDSFFANKSHLKALKQGELKTEAEEASKSVESSHLSSKKL